MSFSGDTIIINPLKKQDTTDMDSQKSSFYVIAHYKVDSPEEAE